MSQPQLSTSALSRRLHVDGMPLAEPAPDLWSRILERHRREIAHARRRRLLAAALAASAVVAAGTALVWRDRPDVDSIDWQARAQALELRLHALEPATQTPTPTAEFQLAQIDGLLQAAYDNGADRGEVIALWKRRSELLDTLVRVRQRQPDINRT